MKTYLTLFFLLFFLLSSFAQDTTITIYFKSGQSKLSASQLNNIQKLKTEHVIKMTVDGYTDTIGKAPFNKQLSYKRAATAAKVITTVVNKQINGKGESKEKKTSLDKMRKVVVKVWYAIPEQVPLSVPAIKIIPKKDPCMEDTLIYVEGGTIINVNKCYYEQIKGCFTYKEYRTAKETQQAGLRTIDDKGAPIESGGMFDIRLCSDTCLKHPIIVLLPVPACLSKEQMTLWTLTKDNRWKNSQNKLKFVTIKGKDYYQVEVYCPGKINCDRPKYTKRKIKVKLKNGLKFKTAALSYDCPLYSITGKYRKRRRIAVFPEVCPNGDPLIYAKVYSKTGDTLTINNINVNEFTKRRKLVSRCNCTNVEKERYLGVFRIRKKYLYKKYVLYRTDIEGHN